MSTVERFRYGFPATSLSYYYLQAGEAAGVYWREGLEPELLHVPASTLLAALAAQSERNPYWGTFHRTGNYDDRVILFADFLEAGEHTRSYLIQATTPGRFSLPATHVEQMYEPEIFGRTASGVVEIK